VLCFVAQLVASTTAPAAQLAARTWQRETCSLQLAALSSQLELALPALTSQCVRDPSHDSPLVRRSPDLCSVGLCCGVLCCAVAVTVAVAVAVAVFVCWDVVVALALALAVLRCALRCCAVLC